jgi:hypothetical protein
MYNNNPETEDILRESMWTMVSSVSRADLRCAVKNVFGACDACLWVKGKNLWPFSLNMANKSPLLNAVHGTAPHAPSLRVNWTSVESCPACCHM